MLLPTRSKQIMRFIHVQEVHFKNRYVLKRLEVDINHSNSKFDIFVVGEVNLHSSISSERFLDYYVLLCLPTMADFLGFIFKPSPLSF